jgi:hypothetical protein
MSGSYGTTTLRFGDMAVGDVGPFKFDWSQWLAPNDALLTTTVVTSASGELPVIGAPGIADGAVIFWMGGGCANTDYSVYCSVTTLAGQAATRRAFVFVAPSVPD